MDKDKLQILIEKFNANDISKEELVLLEKAIEEGKVNLKKFDELTSLNHKLDYTIPEPGESLRLKFYKNLAEHKASRSRMNAIEGLKIWLTNLGMSKQAVQVAFASVLIIVGFGVGYWAQPGGSAEKIDALSMQVSEMRELMMLTLIEKPAATDRLKAVNMAMDASDVDEKMILALLKTLNNDENANVRLASLNSLLRYAYKPEVRQGLVEAIPNQSDAMLQFALAEAMILMQEKNSIQKLEELLKNENINKDVKSKIQETISKLS